MSPRAKGPLSPRRQSEQSISTGSFLALLSPRRKESATPELVVWCIQCKSRKALDGTEICADCSKSARAGTPKNLVLHVHLHESDMVKMISVKPGAAWHEVKYVLECELGSDFEDKDAEVHYDEGKVWVLQEPTDWNLAVLRSKESRIDVYLKPRKRMIPRIAQTIREPPKLRKQGSKWGTLKKGTMRKASNEEALASMVEVDASQANVIEVKWCSECNGRKAAENGLCEDCIKSKSPSKSLTLTIRWDGAEKTLLIDSSLSWDKAKYVMECECDMVGEKISVKTMEGMPIADEKMWREELLRSKEELRVMVKQLGVSYTPRVDGNARRELSFSSN